MPEEENTEIVVSARLKVNRNANPPSIGISLSDWFYARNYGPGTDRPDPFLVEVEVPPQLSASEIVARACDSLALAIQTLTDLGRPFLPRAEAIRLDALAKGLRDTSDALKVGNIDLRTGRQLVQSTFAVAFDALGSVGMGVLFTALGSWATNLAPTPLLKALGAAGFGAIGIALDWSISDSGAANWLAEQMTNALFNGAQALSDFIAVIVDQVHRGVNFIPGSPGYMENYLFNLKAESSVSANVLITGVYVDGVLERYTVDSEEVLELPGGTDGDPKSPWYDDEPI